MIEDAQGAFDRLDILVNNAGIKHIEAVETFPPEKWDQIIAISLSAAFHTIRAVLPGMKARGWGRIIDVAPASCAHRGKQPVPAPLTLPSGQGA